mmetsp:Transcript_10892/g.23475  ORF Transcript_10892/g.23475 Transcript_10892/m.23475 type:complete len:524 (+) Transcript_10892:94-1665(+)
MVSSDDYFNAIPLFMLFRESIEASIVVGIVLSILTRVAPHLKSQAWWGVGLGVAISLTIGMIFAILFYTAQNNLFQGSAQAIFKGVVAWVACIFITLLAFAMLRYKGWEEKLTRRLKGQTEKALAKQKADAVSLELISQEEGSAAGPKPWWKCWGGRSTTTTTTTTAVAGPVAEATEGVDAVEGGARKPWYNRLWLTKDKSVEQAEADGITWKEKYGIFIVTFSTVLREGLESVVFLMGIGNAKPSAIPLSGVIGIACGVTVGIFLYYTGKQVRDIKWLLIIMAVFLFFIAAGASEMGARSLMQAGMFGEYVSPYAEMTATAELQQKADAANGVAVTSANLAFSDGDEDDFIPVNTAQTANDGYYYVRLTPEQPWWQAPLWDISSCCGDTDDENKFLALMKAIFGYNAKPTFIDVVFYLGYWLVVIAMGFYKYYRGTLFDADHKYNKAMKEKAKREALERAKLGDSALPPSESIIRAAEKEAEAAESRSHSNSEIATGSNPPAAASGSGGRSSDESSQAAAKP